MPKFSHILDVSPGQELPVKMRVLRISKDGSGEKFAGRKKIALTFYYSGISCGGGRSGSSCAAVEPHDLRVSGGSSRLVFFFVKRVYSLQSTQALS